MVAEDITRLYFNVMANDIVVNQIHTEAICAGIQKMAKEYSAERANLNSNKREFPDFNNAAFRCGYLHKYAPFHTYIVLEAMLKVLQETKQVFKELLNSGPLKLCCLGGGPGTEVIGVLIALNAVFKSFKASVTVMDCMKEWEFTFRSLIQELRFGEYGDLSSGFKNNNDYEWNYLGANLMDDMTNAVSKSIGSASFITMVKFVSAASCATTKFKIEKIFQVMKPGAVVLFIDNASGGFSELVERVSMQNSFEMLMAPRRHVRYDQQDFKVERFGYSSCFKSTVTILLLRKRLNLQNNNLHVPRNPPSKLVHQILPSSNSRLPPKPSNFNDHQPCVPNSDAYKSPSITDNLNHQPSSCKSPARASNLNSHQLSKSDSYSNKSPPITDNLNYRPASCKSQSPAKESNLYSHQPSKSDSYSNKSPNITDNLNHQPTSSTSPAKESNLSKQDYYFDKSPPIAENLNNRSTSPAKASNLNIHQPSTPDSYSNKSPSKKDNVNSQAVTYDFDSASYQNRRSNSDTERFTTASPRSVDPANAELLSDKNGTSNDTGDRCCTCCVIL